MRPLALLLALGALTQSAAALGSASDVREVLRGHWSGDERTREEVVSALRGLGQDAVPTLFALYSGELDLLRSARGSEELPPERQAWWCDPGQFGPIYLEALGGLDPDEVLDHLRGELRGQPELELRLAAVRVTGELGDPRGLDLLIELGEGFGPLPLRYRSVRKPLESAFARLLDADAEAARALEEQLDRLSPELGEVLVAAAGSVERAEVVSLLGAMLGRRARLDQLVLGVLAEKVEARPWRFDDSVFELMRPSMFSDDWRLRAAATVALGRAGDLDSFSTFTLLLQDEQPSVARAAEWSLRRLSGRDVELTAAEWLAWYEEREQAWFSGRTLRREDLWSDQPKRVMAALRACAEETLFRDEAAAELVQLLDDDQADLRAVACRALAQLGSKRVVPELVPLLDERDDDLRAAAHAALARLTHLPASEPPETFRLLADA